MEERKGGERFVQRLATRPILAVASADFLESRQSRDGGEEVGADPRGGFDAVIMVAKLDPVLRSVGPSLTLVQQQVLLLLDHHRAHQTLILIAVNCPKLSSQS